MDEQSHKNLRQLIISKTTEYPHVYIGIDGIDSFSIEEMVELIQILFNVNQKNLYLRNQLVKEIYE